MNILKEYEYYGMNIVMVIHLQIQGYIHKMKQVYNGAKIVSPKEDCASKIMMLFFPKNI